MRTHHQLRRRLDHALVGGVCAGIAEYMELDPLVIRAGFLGVTAASGIGLILYPLAWALIPPAGQLAPGWRQRLLRWREAIAIAMLTLATLFALRHLGLWLGDAVVWPLLLASCGLALIVRQATSETSAPPRTRRFPGLWRRWPAGGVGILLVSGAAVAFLRYAGILRQSGRSLAETAVVLLAASLITAPYLIGLLRRLSAERAQRIRSEERAEMAAHLHDSVLQTLALIQRRAEDPAQVVALARGQERELRDWLLARRPAGDAPATLRQALEQAAHDVETRHAVRVEAVVVGDCGLDEPARALVAAAREALVNAAKFAGVAQVDLYAEAGSERVEVFVRDRGGGFDPAAVPGDRQGIRHSIVERMARHGGSAEIRSAPGDGTEVELVISRAGA